MLENQVFASSASSGLAIVYLIILAIAVFEIAAFLAHLRKSGASWLGKHRPDLQRIRASQDLREVRVVASPLLHPVRESHRPDNCLERTRPELRAWRGFHDRSRIPRSDLLSYSWLRVGPIRWVRRLHSSYHLS